jgi:hypothetical protein
MAVGAPTIPPDYIQDQCFGVESLNQLVQNNENLWDTLAVDHDEYTGLHQTCKVPTALAIVLWEPEMLDLAVTLGTVTTNKTTTLTGSGTSFLTNDEIEAGDKVTVDPGGGNEETRTIDKLDNSNPDTLLYVTSSFTSSVGSLSFKVHRKTRGPRYYYHPYSWGFIGEPERLDTGRVRLYLRWRGNLGGTNPRILPMVNHWALDWNNVGPAPSLEYKVASASVLGREGLGRDHVEIHLCPKATVVTHEDHPFSVAVWQDLG